MTKIYLLMNGNSQIGDLYFDRDDAIENGKQIARDTAMPVLIWEAEDIDGVPIDELDWTLSTIKFA